MIASPAAANILDAWAEAWRPPAILDRAEWCAENLRLPASTSASAGRYDLTRYAYVKGVLEAVDDPAVEIIVLKWATQLGKTTLLQAILASTAATRPVPAMLVAPDKPAILKLRDKFYALCEQSPGVSDMVPPRASWNTRWIDLGPLRCHLGIPRNTQTLSGESCALVLMTELDRMTTQKGQGSPEKLAAERVKAFFRYKIIYESTPTDENSRIEAQWQLSDQRRFYVPCPHCGHYQPLRFFPLKNGRGGVVGFQDRKGNYVTPDEARASAHYVCEKGCRIASGQKALMIAQGVWCPKGQHVDKHGRLQGEPKKGPRIWGAELNSMYAETISFGDIAGEYLECRDDPDAATSFRQNWLAKIATIERKIPEWKTLGRKLAGPHRRGTAPPGALFIIASVDVQGDYCLWLARAYGEDGRSWLVDWGRIDQKVTELGAPLRNSDLEQIDAVVLDRVFPLPVANALGRTSLPVARLVIDFGDGVRSRDIFAWLKKHPGDRVRAVKGASHTTDRVEPFWLSHIDKDRNGKVYEGGLRLWFVNTDIYKCDIQQAWHSTQEQAGAFVLPSDILDVGETYLRQLANEQRVLTNNKPEWRVLNTNVGNHAFDLEVYNRAAADMHVNKVWDGLLERIKAAEAPDDEDDEEDERPTRTARSRRRTRRRRRSPQDDED